jgi:NAD+ synthase
MYEFNAEKTLNECIAWIHDWFAKNGPDSPAVLGISGGKDSTVTAALCVAALGKERVIGILMPNGTQADIADSIEVVEHLGIRNYTVKIAGAVSAILDEMKDKGIDVTDQSRINLPPRIRMSTVYAVSQCHNGRVANPCNLSDDWVGYSTKYGDAAGDFSPISDFTVREVLAIGEALGLPDRLIHKTPSDGLSGMSDEDKLGFTYEMLDEYILTGNCPDEEIRKKIDRLHAINLHKLKVIPSYKR